MGFKKRKTSVKTESSTGSSNNNAIKEQLESVPIKVEPIASSSLTTVTTAATSAEQSTTLAQAAVAPIGTGPIVMKIGNMNAAGGAKRKFRVREPSP